VNPNVELNHDGLSCPLFPIVAVLLWIRPPSLQSIHRMNTETENEVEERKSFIPTSRPDDHTVNCHDIGEIPRDEDSTFQLDTSVENPPVIEEELETLDHNARRASFMTSSQRTLASIKPEDEVCGWGPLKPGLCQRFRNPKWVLVCLCMAGVCQVSGWSHFRNGPLWL